MDRDIERQALMQVRGRLEVASQLVRMALRDSDAPRADEHLSAAHARIMAAEEAIWAVRMSRHGAPRPLRTPRRTSRKGEN